MKKFTRLKDETFRADIKEKIHTTEEYIAVAEMEKAVKLVIELAEMAS